MLFFFINYEYREKSWDHSEFIYLFTCSVIFLMNTYYVSDTVLSAGSIAMK